MNTRETISRMMGLGTQIVSTKIPKKGKGDESEYLVIVAYTSNILPGTGEQKLIDRLLSKHFKDRPDFDEISKTFRYNPHVVFEFFEPTSGVEKCYDHMVTKIERCWHRGRRVILEEVVKAWLPDYKVVMQRHHYDQVQSTVTMVVPPNFQLNNETHSEIDYLTRTDTPETAKRIGRLLKNNGAIAVNFVRDHTLVNEISLAEEVRNWAMACSA